MYLKFFKPVLAAAVCQFILNAVSAQSVAINTDGSVADGTAILDVKSSAKGLLIPRLTSAQRTGITTPATGLLVFDTDTNAFWYYNGTGWLKLDVAGNNWSLGGNSGTTAGTHYIGTSDNKPLVIKVNSQNAGFIGITGIGGSNTSWGYQALLNNITGVNSTAVGAQALINNTSGVYNTAIGSGALYSNTSGYSNTAIGTTALHGNVGGMENTAVGLQALISNVGGGGNTAIGNYANVSAGNLSNATAIGYSAIVNASNKVRIGNSAVTVIEGQVPFTTPSDGRFKYNIKEDVKGLDFILHLRPVTYQFDVEQFDAALQNRDNKEAFRPNRTLQTSYNEAAAIRRTGFIAQEVEKAAVKSDYDFSGISKPKTPGGHYSLSYESFVVPLVKAVQELSAKVEMLTKDNELLRKNQVQLQLSEVEKPQQQIDALQKIINKQQQALEELTKRLEKLEKP
jgi:hypothetical protein